MTLSTVEFQPLHADDEDTMAAWLALLADAAADPVGDPLESPPPCPVDLAGSVRFAPPDTTLEDWVVRHPGGDGVVASLRLAFPAGAPSARVDQLLVHPSARRGGIGTALYEHVLRRAAEHGRSQVTATVVEPLPDGPPRDTGPAEFAAAVGASRLTEGAGVHQWLDLQRHDPLAGGVPPVPGGYRLVTWGTVTPEEYALAVSALELSLGGASLEDAEAAAADLVADSYARRFEKMRVGRGRRAYHTGVIHEASGKLVGYTSISKTTGNPQHALQGMTVVHTSHRGHGLGRVIKLANLDLARLHEPALRMIETTNAEDNAAMIAVNTALGFRPRDRWVIWRALTSA